jgi:aerobic-type carbon monoxide dehydrogenase small subunit (CoxS/CutS family)
MNIRVSVNGDARTFAVEPGELLLDVLRREGLKGVKFGCGEGDCGSCTVLLDGEPVNSCLVLASRVHGHDIVTIEGLGTVDAPHPLQLAFSEEGAVQCGYCIPGMILSAYALLCRQPDPGDAEILDALDGNLCRCTGYVKNVVAIRSAAAHMREQDDGC